MWFGCFINVKAQQVTWAQFVEDMAAGDEEDDDFSDFIWEELYELHRQPMNINRAGRDDLLRLPFLDEEQVEEIQAYIYKHGPLKTLSELQLINILDYSTRAYLSLFVYAGDAPVDNSSFRLKTLLRDGKNELMTRMDVPLYERDGYAGRHDYKFSTADNKKYVGNALYSNVRYSYRYRRNLYLGFTAEKDPGEPFGRGVTRGYDFYSYHFLLKSRGFLHTLALGDYKLSFGQGLVLQSGFSFGKTALLLRNDRNQGIRRYYSTSEQAFMRGGGATVQCGQVLITAFFSQRKVDAILSDRGEITSLKTDGYHRTMLEISRRRNVLSRTVGGDITWQTDRLQLGVTGYYQFFNRLFITGNAFYRAHYPTGYRFGLTGVHYAYRRYRLSFAGETAYSTNRSGWATLNKLHYRLTGNYRFTLLHRYYSPDYYSFHARSFGEGSAVRNENGVYLGVEASPVEYIQLFSYIDIFYFPWPAFGMSHSSQGAEYLLQAKYKAGRRAEWLCRYRFKRKERYDVMYNRHNVKGQFTYDAPCGIQSRTTVLFNAVNSIKGTSYGILAGEQLVAGVSRIKCKLAGSLAYFHSDDYESRLYHYEPMLLHTFASNMYSGQGLRLALTARWMPASSWTVEAKYGLTRYFDRDEQASGLQRIAGPAKSDLSFQLRYRF